MQRTVFEAYVHAVRRQRQSRVLFGTLSNRRGTTIEHCTLYEWHRKVKLYNVVRQRCKMRGWRLVTRIFHLWRRSALYTALMRKARHMMHEVHHIQVTFKSRSLPPAAPISCVASGPPSTFGGCTSPSCTRRRRSRPRPCDDSSPTPAVPFSRLGHDALSTRMPLRIARCALFKHQRHSKTRTACSSQSRFAKPCDLGRNRTREF